jgi:hypothetical protein
VDLTLRREALPYLDGRMGTNFDAMPPDLRDRLSRGFEAAAI